MGTGFHRFVAALSLAGLSASPIPLVSASAVGEPVPALVGVAPQYDATHVYVAPEDVDRFAASFIATFGGQSTNQAVVTVTPTPSKTTSQLIHTPVGAVSLFGFETPIPYPFGSERVGLLVTDIDAAVKAARDAGAELEVAPFQDPIGRDAIIQWPGGVDMQLYWHFAKPSYAPLQSVPEMRVYVSHDRADDFIRSFLAFSQGKVVSDDRNAPGVEIGRPDDAFRRVRLESVFGKIVVNVTDGHLPYPYGRELTGYEVSDLAETLAKATASGAKVLVEPYTADNRKTSIVAFPGGYIAEIHSVGHD